VAVFLRTELRPLFRSLTDFLWSEKIPELALREGGRQATERRIRHQGQLFEADTFTIDFSGSILFDGQSESCSFVFLFPSSHSFKCRAGSAEREVPWRAEKEAPWGEKLESFEKALTTAAGSASRAKVVELFLRDNLVDGRPTSIRGLIGIHQVLNQVAKVEMVEPRLAGVLSVSPWNNAQHVFTLKVSFDEDQVCSHLVIEFIKAGKGLLNDIYEGEFLGKANHYLDQSLLEKWRKSDCFIVARSKPLIFSVGK